MMLASIVLPRPTSSARIARPPIWRSTRWATSIWWGSSLIALASRVISRSKPGTSAIRSASRRRSYQARSAGGCCSWSANALIERSSTDQVSSAGVAGGAGEESRSGIRAQYGIGARRECAPRHPSFDQLMRHRVGHDAEVMVRAVVDEVAHARRVHTGEIVNYGSYHYFRVVADPMAHELVE